MSNLLNGIRIVDLTRGVAGPTATMILGDLGAEVIQIEPPGGTTLRHAYGPRHRGESFEYLTLNRNKKSVVLNLTTTEGKKAIYDLVRVSDVFIANFRAGVLERLSLGYETLAKLNPALIYCSMTGFGSSGPYSQRKGIDANISAMTGLMSLMAEPGRMPPKAQPALIDSATGLYATIAILAALFKRKETNQGQKLEVSLLDSAVSLAALAIQYYLMGGGVLQNLGSRHVNIAPMGCFHTKDGFIVLGSCWPRIAHVLGADWLMEDDRFTTRQGRVEHREELDEILNSLLRKENTEDWLALFDVEDITAAPINTIDKVVADPQVNHNKMFLTITHALGGEFKIVRNPLKFSANELDYCSPPTLGQYTENVLQEILGYDEELTNTIIRQGGIQTSEEEP